MGNSKRRTSSLFACWERASNRKRSLRIEAQEGRNFLPYLSLISIRLKVEQRAMSNEPLKIDRTSQAASVFQTKNQLLFAFPVSVTHQEASLCLYLSTAREACVCFRPLMIGSRIGSAPLGCWLRLVGLSVWLSISSLYMWQNLANERVTTQELAQNKTRGRKRRVMPSQQMRWDEMRIERRLEIAYEMLIRWLSSSLSLSKTWSCESFFIVELQPLIDD